MLVKITLIDTLNSLLPYCKEFSCLVIHSVTPEITYCIGVSLFTSRAYLLLAPCSGPKYRGHGTLLWRRQALCNSVCEYTRALSTLRIGSRAIDIMLSSIPGSLSRQTRSPLLDAKKGKMKSLGFRHPSITVCGNNHLPVLYAFFFHFFSYIDSSSLYEWLFFLTKYYFNS